ncbi:MAG: hypothetical protein QXY74_06365 [Candidatus Bathyarchaeia archaeon]
MVLKHYGLVIIMKNAILLAAALTMMLMIFSSASTYAQPTTVNIYAWTDKSFYDPGENGKLTIVVRNDRADVDLILYNITVEYPWFAYTGEKWEGNDTIIIGETLLKNGGVKIYSRPFNVPSDGRAAISMYGAQIYITVNVDKPPYHYSRQVPIYIRSVAQPMAISDWDKMLTLLTIQVALVIVCTIILAATIFLSVRRPRVVFEEALEKTG